MDSREQRILASVGLIVAAVGGVALMMDVVLPGVLALGTALLIGLAVLVSEWFNDE